MRPTVDASFARLRPRLLGGCVGAALSCLGVVAASAGAAPGDLDLGFGSAGTVITDVGAGDPGQFTQPAGARGVAVQADGKIVATGRNAKLARYNRDGSPDVTFGVDGKVDTAIRGVSVAVAADGKLVVAGSVSQADCLQCPMWAVARYNPDGSLDTSFANGGTAVNRFRNGRYPAVAIADRVLIQPDGKILAAGDTSSQPASFLIRSIAVVRYTTDGRPDPQFSTDGQTQIPLDITNGGGFGLGIGLALQGDGKIVVGTNNDPSVVTSGPTQSGNQDFFLARRLPSGDPDPDFGDPKGMTRTTFAGIDQLTDIAIQGDGIVAVGQTSGFASPPDFVTPPSDFAVARYRQSDGSLDPSFGNGGKVVTDLGGEDVAHAVAVQSDGKLLVAGSSSATADVSDPSDFALARYGKDGALDTGFGDAGRLTTRLGPTNDVVFDLAIQPDDAKIIAAGSSLLGGNEAFALARYAASSAGLSLIAGGSRDPVTVGETLTYTLTATNHGPDGARSVGLTDSLSSRVRYASWSSSQGSCAPSADGRSVSCALGDLAAGASATVQIVVATTRSGTATDSATVASSTEDPDDSDDSVALTTTINPAAPPAPPAPLATGGTRPVLSALSLSPASFRAARSGPSIAGAAGARVSYRLSEPASVRFSVERVLTGRRSHDRCVKPKRSNSRAAPCTRFVTVRGSFTHPGKAGSNALRFTGRLAGRRLVPGRYRLLAVATDAAGTRSSPRHVRLRIIGDTSVLRRPTR